MHHGCVQATLMRSHGNRKKEEAEFNPITKCNHSGMSLTNVASWIGIPGISIHMTQALSNYTVWERLDKAVATNEWLSIFRGTKVHHIDITCSDHKPLWIVPDGMDCSFQKPFRFEQMWMLDKGCSDTIEAVWKERINEPSDTQVIRKVDRSGKNSANGVKNVLRVFIKT